MKIWPEEVKCQATQLSTEKKSLHWSSVLHWLLHIDSKCARMYFIFLSRFTKHFFQSSNKPVPVFTHKAFHIQNTFKHTLSLSLTHTHKHTPRYQTLKDMNHKQLTSSRGLNECHASITNIRRKIKYLLFFFSFSVFYCSINSNSD